MDGHRGQQSEPEALSFSILSFKIFSSVVRNLSLCLWDYSDVLSDQGAQNISMQFFGPLQQAETVTLRRLGVMNNGVNIVCAAANVLGSPINATHHVDVTAGKMFAIVEIWMH